MHANPPLNKVVIVGGGSAGWITAALLSRMLMGYQITLIESEEIGIIGVGEATIPPIKIFNELCGVDRAEFIRATQATFKLGIEFVNWGEIGDSYIHGFGKIGNDLMWLHTHQFWLKLRQKGLVKHFDHYSLNTLACRLNKFAPPDMSQPGTPLADIDYAYHFDASLYAGFLRRICEGRGVKRIEGKIVTARLRPEDGFVDHVVMENGQEVGGDLFIDCSGMRGLLIEKALGVGYEDWNQWLLNDRAWAVPCERVDPMTPYTRSTAHGSGWQWRIPLQHRTGNGHVFSSNHISEDEAASVLMKNLDGKALADPRLVKFRTGKRLKAWDKNVVAIGLSSGFLEPLESTSIHLITSGVMRLLSLMPGRAFNQADIDEYNRLNDSEYLDIRDFIIAHYKVTEREDTPYWKYLKHMDVPQTLTDRMDLFRASGRFFRHIANELFREESWVQVLLGQRFEAQYDPTVDMIPEADIIGHMKDIEEVIADAASRLPDHAAYIAQNCAARRVFTTA